MKSRKAFITIVIGLSLIVVFFTVYILTRTQNDRIPVGKYRIKDNDKYPDAYIEVTEHTIQYFNIDFLWSDLWLLYSYIDMHYGSR